MTTELKVCTKCHLELPISKFAVAVKATSKRRARCNDCESARVRAYYAANAVYRENQKVQSTGWRKANPTKTAVSQRKNLLKSKYGLTVEQYDQLLASQDTKCALCGATEHGRWGNSEGRKWLSDSWPVDHCHKDNRVRGVLCHPCNAQLGGYEVLLEKVGEAALLEYLSRPSPVLALPVPVVVPNVRETARFVAELPPRYARGQCTVCGEDQHANSLCFKHYMRSRRSGTVELTGSVRGAGHHKSTLTEDQAREIKFSADKGADLARRFNVKPSVVSSIRHGHTWKHLMPQTLQ